jgi:Phospholipase_D-nuclease N-terminal/Short C-terminal domain
VIVAADYPFLDLMWTMIVFVAWILWIWMVIIVLSDVFRRRDASGAKKVVWTLFIIFLPLIGVLVYLIANGDSMAERSAKEARAQQTQFDDYVRSVADSGGAAAEIERAKGLLDSGAISQAEFDAIKEKALAAA